MGRFKIIQGGMGVGVSGWRLANAVASRGQLGVVSGTGLAVVLTRRLQEGDPGGHYRRALAHFPVPEVTERVLGRYFLSGGKRESDSFLLPPMPRVGLTKAFDELTVLANFAEVFLAKEGHRGPVGINYLEKIQIPTLPSLFGAMLAGVDYVLMGAGVPRLIPGILDGLAELKPVELRIDVVGSTSGQAVCTKFDPQAILGGVQVAMRRPTFLAIVSSLTLAQTLVRKSTGRVDGFVVENADAGGHNAPPRGHGELTVDGEPAYGPRDDVDLERLAKLGLPFWLAGGFSSREQLDRALASGASGVQVGTAFAFCDESGVEAELKQRVIQLSCEGEARVFTDPAASPTGFPFKVLQVPESLSDRATYEQRERICDLGYLRHAYEREDGSIGYRCPAEPVEQYVAKGGEEGETVGRKCICNALFATIGLGQVREGQVESMLMTCGKDVVNLPRFVKPGSSSYSAGDVLRLLLGEEELAVSVAAPAEDDLTLPA